MVTIYNTDKVLLWGGNDKGSETWVFDLSDGNWTKKSPATTPNNGKLWPAMAPINGTDNVVLFGGTDKEDTFSSYSKDTYIYDLSMDNWYLKTTTNTPTRRAKHSMTTIYDDDKVILFGGMNYNVNTLTKFNDTWR
jgi:N-acetylneuraminic acid mutarotase